MRIFALEYFRQIINSDEVNFLSAKKKTQFKIKNQLGHFICNNREAGPKADNILQQMNFKNSFMWQYDPHGVINKLRLKVKLGTFIHHPGLDIDRFSNQSECIENTLIDMENTVVDVENTLIDVEKKIDTSSLLQVLALEELMNIPPLLQTPANEDKNEKRTREEGYSSAMETTDDQFEISYRKMPKLNLVTEQEDTIDTVEISDTEAMVGRNKGPTASEETHQPSTLNTQPIEKQIHIEVSSSSKLVDKEKDIKEKYKEIKLRNEALKAETYA